MQAELAKSLAPVRNRMLRNQLLANVVAGLSFAAILSLTASLAGVAFGAAFSWWVAAAVLLAGPLIALVVTYRRAPSLVAAAHQADDHGGWSDLMTTALTVPGNQGAGAIVRQQARAKLGQINASRIVPMQIPPRILSHGCLWILAFAALALPLFDGFALTADQPSSNEPLAIEPLPERNHESSALTGAALAKGQRSLVGFDATADNADSRTSDLATLADRDIVRAYFLAAQARTASE